jgi:hypothetical protein
MGREASAVGADVACGLPDALLFIANTILRFPQILVHHSSFSVEHFLSIESRGGAAGSIPAGNTFLLFFCMSETVVHLPSVWVLVPGRFTAGTPSFFDVSGGRRIYGRYVHPTPAI